MRQSDDSCLLPKSVSTRFYINLSNDDNFDEQFELLLRELHQEPASKKPPLGKNPFAQQPSGVEIPTQSEIESPIPDLGKLNDDLSLIYNSALTIARNGDLVSWRKLSRQATLPTSEKLNALRKKYESQPPRSL